MHVTHLVLYDGVCGLCSRFVQLLLRHDRRGLLRFAALQSELAREVLGRHGLDAARLDTVYVVADYEGAAERPYSRASAVLFALAALGGVWVVLGWLRALPRRWLDAGYDRVAARRYGWFGRSEHCMVPALEHRARFLDVGVALPAEGAGEHADAVSRQDGEAERGVAQEGDALDVLPAELRRRPWMWRESSELWLTREVFLRTLGALYAVAFSIAFLQAPALIGDDGILPARWYFDDLGRWLGARGLASHPSVFMLGSSDVWLEGAAGLGIALALAAALGRHSGVSFALLWVLQLSFLHAGQIFWGYGWELLLAETGFLAIFFAAPWRLGPLPRSVPPTLLAWALRWLAFRLMFGAGLIKVRGDPCWLDLSCLDFHFETQPNPHPLTPWFHFLPPGAHRAGVVFNHLAELVAPWALFGPRRLRWGAVAVMSAFQLALIASGNLAFLNWLSLVVFLGCLDDGVWRRLLPRAWCAAAAEGARVTPAAPRARERSLWAVGVLLAVLSVGPALNLLSPSQAMNASFDPLHLVNTYGAFGSVERERHEVVLEGTYDDPLSREARWVAYTLPCQPGDPRRRPCLVTPYHYRLDWQLWFAGLGDLRQQPWLARLVRELLRGNRRVATLFAGDPFAERPPRYLRALLYRYELVHGEPGVWWRRELIGEYLRPVAADDAELVAFLERRGWMR